MNMLRYTLIYSDDVLHDLLDVKREVLICRPHNDGGNAYYEFDSNKMDNDNFVEKLRKEKGIFFNFNVSPSSPRKVRSPQLSPKHPAQYKDLEIGSRYECNQSLAGADKGSVTAFQYQNYN